MPERSRDRRSRARIRRSAVDVSPAVAWAPDPSLRRIGRSRRRRVACCRGAAPVGWSSWSSSHRCFRTRPAMPASRLIVISMRCTCSYLIDPECSFAETGLACDRRPPRMGSNSRPRDDANRADFDVAMVFGGRFDPRAGEVCAVSGDVVTDVCSDIGLLSRFGTRRRAGPASSGRDQTRVRRRWDEAMAPALGTAVAAAPAAASRRLI